MGKVINWVEVIQKNRDSISKKMVELSRNSEGANVSTALGLKEDGTLFTWEANGIDSFPDSIESGEAIYLDEFSPWDWTDGGPYVDDGKTKEDIINDVIEVYETEELPGDLDLIINYYKSHNGVNTD